MTHICKVAGTRGCHWWVQSKGSSTAAQGEVSVAAAHRMLHSAGGIRGRSSTQIVLHNELIEVHVIVVAVPVAGTTHCRRFVTSVAVCHGGWLIAGSRFSGAVGQLLPVLSHWESCAVVGDQRLLQLRLLLCRNNLELPAVLCWAFPSATTGSSAIRGGGDRTQEKLQTRVQWWNWAQCRS